MRGTPAGASQATVDAAAATAKANQDAYGQGIATKYGLEYDPATGKLYGHTPNLQAGADGNDNRVEVPFPAADGTFYVSDASSYAAQALQAAGAPAAVQESNGNWTPVGPRPDVGGGVFGPVGDAWGKELSGGLDATLGAVGRNVVTPVFKPVAEALGPTIADIASIFGAGTGAGGTPVDTTALTTAIADANRLRDQYNVTPTPGVLPQAQASLMGPVERAQQQAAIEAQQIQAAQIGAYQAAQQGAAVQAGVATGGQSTASQISSTALAQQQAAIQAERVQAALVQRQGDIGAERVTAAQAGRTVLDPTALATNTEIDPVSLASMTQLAPVALSEKEKIDAALQAEFRARQTGLVTGLEGAISGNDPSVAAILLRQETERNIANQYALAQGATGMNTGLAQRQAMINAADINQQSIGQKALLRAQEIATSRGQLATVLDQGRGQDISLSTSQAGLNQGVNLANTQATNTGALAQLDADTRTKLANAGFVNTQNMNQAQLDQAVQLANAGFKNQATTTQAQLDSAQKLANMQQANQVAVANADRALDAAKTNVTLAQQAALANQSAENTARLANAENELRAATTNATLAQQVALANAASLNDTAKVNATLANATGIANAGNQTQASVATAANQTSAANTSATLASQIAQANARNQLDQQMNQARLTQEAATANAGNNLAAGTSNATLAQAVALANAQAANQASTTNANNQTSVNQSNNTAGMTQQQIDALARQNAASNTLEAQRIAQQAAAAAAQAQARQAAASAAQRNADLQMITTLATKLVPSVPSDRRVKKNIEAADVDVDELMRALRSYQFDYKNPKSPGASEGRRFGVMAQDLEKSRAGRSLVIDTPTGKMVDTNRAVMAALAALGSVNKRLEHVERRAA